MLILNVTMKFVYIAGSILFGFNSFLSQSNGLKFYQKKIILIFMTLHTYTIKIYYTTNIMICLII
jgi:hypothetical protein